jgi:multiple sugar transport system substrate-binding protein
MRRLRWIAMLTAAVGLALGACSSGGQGSGDGDVTLDFWVFEEGGLFAEKVVEAFEKENPGVSVEVTAFPEDNYGVKLDTALAAGKAPDLVLVFGPDYMRQGLLLPLDEAVAQAGIDLSTYSQAIVKGPSSFSCAWEEKLFCLGSYQGAVMTFYNKDLFDAAGIPHPKPWPAMTPDEFVDIACELTDADRQIWGAAYADPLGWAPWELVVSENGREARGHLNSPESVHVFERLAAGITDKCAPSLDVLDPWEQGVDYFSRGQLGMVITDFQGLNKIENADIDYGVTTNPTPAGMEPYFYVWTDSVGVLKESDHPDEAKEFVTFLATEGQRIRVEDTGDVPLDSEIAEELNWAEGVPGRADGLEILKHARPPVFMPDSFGTYAPVSDAWGLILAGEKTAKQALDDITPAVQENLDKSWQTWKEQENRQ